VAPHTAPHTGSVAPRSTRAPTPANAHAAPHPAASPAVAAAVAAVGTARNPAASSAATPRPAVAAATPALTGVLGEVASTKPEAVGDGGSAPANALGLLRSSGPPVSGGSTDLAGGLAGALALFGLVGVGVWRELRLGAVRRRPAGVA
jgi:hypothetical protein